MTDSSSRAQELIQEGLAVSATGRASDAIALFAEASAAAPGSGIPHFLIGSEYAAMREMGKAEEAFSTAVLLAPELRIARYQLGLLQFSSARVAAAFLTWEPLRNAPAEDPLRHFVEGYTALAQDQFEAALAHFDQGLALNTSNEPLSDDIRKVMAGIRAVQASPSPDASSNDEPPESEHVFLANYQRQGTLH